MNDDSYLDIVTRDGGGDVDVFLNNQDGTFQSPLTKSLAGGDGYQVVVGNFDADPALDVVAPDYGNGKVAFLHGNGNGTLEDSVTSDANHANSIAAGDFNDDGKLDLAVGKGADDNTCAVNILHGNGDGTFAPDFCNAPDTATGGSVTNFVLAKKFDKSDHIPEVAAGTNLGVDVWLDPCRGSGC
jgi:hypothetical protein